MKAAMRFLASAQNGDGGWGYAVGQASTAEATWQICMPSDRRWSRTVALGATGQDTECWLLRLQRLQ